MEGYAPAPAAVPVSVSPPDVRFELRCGASCARGGIAVYRLRLLLLQIETETDTDRDRDRERDRDRDRRTDRRTDEQPDGLTGAVCKSACRPSHTFHVSSG